MSTVHLSLWKTKSLCILYCIPGHILQVVLCVSWIQIQWMRGTVSTQHMHFFHAPEAGSTV